MIRDITRPVLALLAVLTPLLASCSATTPTSVAIRPAAVLGDPAPVQNIDRMAIAVDRAIEMAGRHGAANILVVFDLDSTLLRDPDRSPDLDAIEASDPARFRQIERTVMYLKSLVPTERGLACQLERLHTAGIPTYLLTARGRDMRDMTIREMAANGLVLPPAPECGPPLCIGRGMIHARQVMDAATQVVGARELERLEFDRGRDITVWDGIMMAAGLDKGVMMQTLGGSLGIDVKGYVFIDDAAKNTDAVARASRAMREEVAIFHYRSPERGPVRSQAQADTAWKRAQAAICSAFAPRWCDDIASNE